MTNDYDRACVQCVACYHLVGDSYPNGKPYKACRRYGYILHSYKGISLEQCDGYQTEEMYKAELQRKELMKKNRRK